MKKSINAWSVDVNETFEEMFSHLSACGFEAVELNIDVEPAPHALTMNTTLE